MCTVCGCGQTDPSGEHGVSTQGSSGHHHHHLDEPHHHHHDTHHHEHEHHHYGRDAAGLSVSGFSQRRLIEIEQSILSQNDRDALSNREALSNQKTLALNLMSSPGAGKTTLLVETVRALKTEQPVGVVEGDQQTRNDAQRIEACGVPAVQINTGRGCHLDAHMVGHALSDLAMPPNSVVFIENVGNLVCPAAFDLGENAKVVILSVTEGDDKPLKYPDMFAAAQLMIVSKTDLLAYLDFDVDAAIERAQRINPALSVIKVSAKTGEGMPEWLAWIRSSSQALGEMPSSNETLFPSHETQHTADA